MAIVLGGASQNHALRTAVLELASLPLLGVAALRLWEGARWKGHVLALSVAAAVVAVPLLQLAPLPPALWTALPGREGPALALELAGVAPGWSPYSLTPDFTLRSLLALLPPLAVFLAALTVSGERIDPVVRVVLAVLGASLALALLQAVTGDFYPAWAPERRDPSGLFANRNHLATACLMMLPFCLHRVGRALKRGAEGHNAAAMWGVLAALSLVAPVALQSRMGAVLAVPTLLASLAVMRASAGASLGGPRVLGGVVAALVAASVIIWLASGPVISRFEAGAADSASDMRKQGWPVAFEAAQSLLPGGAGLGSFDRVYRSVEPLEQISPIYFNRAHNDYLEILLETGWVGIGVLIAFLIWFGRRFLQAWRRDGTRERAALAAGVAILAVLGHSTVDYPIRTLAVASLFALCCGIMERRPEPASRRRR